MHAISKSKIKFLSDYFSLIELNNIRGNKVYMWRCHSHALPFIFWDMLNLKSCHELEKEYKK